MKKGIVLRLFCTRAFVLRPHSAISLAARFSLLIQISCYFWFCDLNIRIFWMFLAYIDFCNVIQALTADKTPASENVFVLNHTIFGNGVRFEARISDIQFYIFKYVAKCIWSSQFLIRNWLQHFVPSIRIGFIANFPLNFMKTKKKCVKRCFSHNFGPFWLQIATLTFLTM